ncbi:MAG: hypothetical protein E7599_03195 [Ruminococcaceae bacterium]|nr:hypothetical protein [Oscillospiraceae bacterium]
MTKKRILSYDVIRIVAALAVVMVHVAAPFITSTRIGSEEFVTGNVYGSFSRIGVQMFVMLSGALTLREDRTYTFSTMWRSIRNLLLLLFFWSAIYAVVHPLSLGYTITFETTIEKFFTGHYHLWYLFMLIGLHLITPILRTFVKKENRKYVGYYILLAMIFTFTIPLFKFFYSEFGGSKAWILNYSEKFQIGILGNYIAYYLLGWYLTSLELSKKTRIYIYAAGIVGCAMTVFGSIYYSGGTVRAYRVFFHNFTLNVMCMSAAVFVFLYYFFKHRTLGPLVTAAVTKLASLTFGVYILHIYVLTVLARLTPRLFEYGILPAPILAVCQWLIIAVISFAITYILSKIPLLKKVVKN